MLKRFIFIAVFMMSAGYAGAVNVNELNPEFFTRFNDDCLVYYINQAIENNHNAKQATYQVEQYRQQAKYSLGKEHPSFSVSADYLGINTPKVDYFKLSKSAFVLPFQVNYEADFLLKNRDKTRSYKKAFEASRFEEKAVYISLLSDVATVYTNILEYDALISNQEKITENNKQILDYNNKKFARGVISTNELNKFKQKYEDSENNLFQYRKEREILAMQLAVLSGISAQNAGTLNTGEFINFEYNGQIPQTVSSDVIFARPDVQSAEKQLEKAKIDVRVARKEFLPSFNITGIWAFNTIAPGSFFSWNSSLALLLAGATQDIFTGGRKIANLKFQKAKYEELFEYYRQTDLEAVKEVNTALCINKYDKDIEISTKSKLNYEAVNFNNNTKKFSRGVISSPNLLQEQNNYLASENEYIKAKTQRLVNYFTLYKAVGGKL